MASGSLPSFTVLTEEDDVPGSKFEREPEEYTVGQLKRWLKCRGLKLSGKRDELLKRVSDCIKSGNHHTLDRAGIFCRLQVAGCRLKNGLLSLSEST